METTMNLPETFIKNIYVRLLMNLYSLGSFTEISFFTKNYMFKLIINSFLNWHNCEGILMRIAQYYCQNSVGKVLIQENINNGKKLAWTCVDFGFKKIFPLVSTNFPFDLGFNGKNMHLKKTGVLNADESTWSWLLMN